MKIGSKIAVFVFVVSLILCEHQYVSAQPAYVYNGRNVGAAFFQAMKCGGDLYAEGKYGDANVQFLKAARLAPKNPDALSYCAETYSRMGRFNEAFKCYERLVRVDPKNEDALFNCADTLTKAGKDADALRFYQKAIDVNPKDEAANWSCCRCLESLHRLNEALTLLRKWTVDNHDSVRSFEECGRLLLLMNKPKEAIPYFEKASALSNDEAIWLQWSTAFVMLGKIEEAVNVCRDFERRFPEFEKADNEMQKRIDILQEKKATIFSAPSDLMNHSYVNEINVHRLRCSTPITVYLTPGRGVKYWTPELDKIMRLAFSDWTKSSGNLVVFKFVDKPQAARIICSWTANPADMPRYAAGVTNFESYSGSFHERARIKIFTVHFNCTPSSRDIRSIAVHEIGHALGIDGHSGIPSDTMYYSPEFDNSNDSSQVPQAISERDVSTLKQIYGVAQAKTTLASSRRQAQHVTMCTSSAKVGGK